MRQVLVLVHCQEANRHDAEEGFIERLAKAIQDRGFDEVIHLSAPVIWGAKDSPIFDEISESVGRIVEWNYSGFEPSQRNGDISDVKVDEIFEGIYCYQEAGLERMEQSHWNIPLADRRYVRERYKDNRIFYQDDDYSRQFAWIPEIFRNPLEWLNTRVTLGGLFDAQCVEDVSQILYWMRISHYSDPELVSREIK